MSQNVRVEIPNGLVLVLDPDTGVLPEDLDKRLITLGPSSIAIVVMNPFDNDVSLSLGKADELPTDKGLELRWRGMLETSGRLGIINVYYEVLLEMPVAGTVEISVWTERVLEPELIWVVVHER
ncbi:MAG: hypothetical protein QM705_07365 [Ancrocorticia sp.]